MSTFDKKNNAGLYVQPYGPNCSVPYSKGYISLLSNTKFLSPNSLDYRMDKMFNCRSVPYQFPGTNGCDCNPIFIPSLGIYGPVSNPIVYPGGREDFKAASELIFKGCKSCNKK